MTGFSSNATLPGVPRNSPSVSFADMRRHSLRNAWKRRQDTFACSVQTDAPQVLNADDAIVGADVRY